MHNTIYSHPHQTHQHQIDQQTPYIMFNTNTLQQLKQLKQDIREQQDIAQGIVRGTKGKFGFVNLDDGREAFLAPDEMLRVIPGDRVEVSVTTSGGEKKDGNKTKIKITAKLEKLINSELKTFVGRYVVRGKGHFVEPDMPQFTRWTFLPPKNRGKAADGDFILCKISRHPFHNEGKGQAHVLERLGNPSDEGIEHPYTVALHNLPHQWPKDTEALCSEIEAALPETLQQREDLSALPFVTIDSATTLDMDDALLAESTPDGWVLRVAIADPSSLITPESALDRCAQQRANTVYLPGAAINMLPDALSHHTFSLQEDTLKPALVCTLNIDKDGAIKTFTFSEAAIKSHQKFSYEGLSLLLTEGAKEDLDPALHESLKQLQAVADARREYRQKHALIMQTQTDYELHLDDQGKIKEIGKIEHNLARTIVEEAMLATNISAGEFLHEHNAGIFSTHAGFRDDRIDNVHSLLEEAEETLDGDLDITTLNGYRSLIQSLNSREQASETLGSLRRMLRPGKLSASHEPHLGMGLGHYATITSPIRRYHDLYNHRAIKSVLLKQDLQLSDETLVDKLQSQIVLGRQACRYMEQWLHRQYMKGKASEEHDGTIVLINSQGIGVRMEETGVTGFVLMRDKDNKPNFDQLRLKMTLNDKSYRPDQQVRVKFVAVDENQRSIQLALLP